MRPTRSNRKERSFFMQVDWGTLKLDSPLILFWAPPGSFMHRFQGQKVCWLFSPEAVTCLGHAKETKHAL